MEQLTLIAAAVVMLVLVMSLVGLGALRWTSFNSRVDRRSMERHRLEALWGAVIKEAERRAQNEKLRPH